MKIKINQVDVISAKPGCVIFKAGVSKRARCFRGSRHVVVKWCTYNDKELKIHRQLNGKDFFVSLFHGEHGQFRLDTLFPDLTDADYDDLRSKAKMMNQVNVITQNLLLSGTKRKTTVLVQELMDGSLDDESLKGATEKRQKKVIAEVKKAVDYLNSRGISHGDLTLRNVLYRGNKIKVGDFGSAREMNKENAPENMDFFAHQVREQARVRRSLYKRPRPLTTLNH